MFRSEVGLDKWIKLLSLVSKLSPTFRYSRNLKNLSHKTTSGYLSLEHIFSDMLFSVLHMLLYLLIYHWCKSRVWTVTSYFFLAFFNVWSCLSKSSTEFLFGTEHYHLNTYLPIFEGQEEKRVEILGQTKSLCDCFWMGDNNRNLIIKSMCYAQKINNTNY